MAFQKSRRPASGVAATRPAATGSSPSKALAEARTFKLAHTTETRNSCLYCAVGCGFILHSNNGGEAFMAILHPYLGARIR